MATDQCIASKLLLSDKESKLQARIFPKNTSNMQSLPIIDEETNKTVQTMRTLQAKTMMIT